MKFIKANIHYQNSSKSVTLSLPEFLFRGHKVIRAFVVVGLLLLVVQLAATLVYDGVLGHVLKARIDLDKQMAQIEGTLEYLDGTSTVFFKDEQRVHSKFALTPPDEEAREMGTGGFIGPDSLLIRETSPVFERMALLRENAGRIQNKLEMNSAAFASLSEYVGQQQSRWRYIPSIAPTSGRFGSPFGPRIHPVTGEIGRMHQGVDISNERWTPIFATADGVVEQAKNSPSFGNYVAINHGNNLKTRYGHMQMLLVKPGQLVRRYQIIGYMGSTGMSTGTHLHYEVWVGDRPVNPVAYILPGDYSVD
ncbi:M23 family metallopeptidase [Fibrobacter sp. UWR2]|uniref:M23 family metallopeptidase n=1 Tax=Fibrobacter sp. UWR2 TaxID=1964352 RepID=UPI000B522267|nr:M23 family metallopeptidase [Fibrobacter sp. UWR2]OWV00093.1 peptidase M23 [Fibrobacter sp. UWR2]